MLSDSGYVMKKSFPPPWQIEAIKLLRPRGRGQAWQMEDITLNWMRYVAQVKINLRVDVYEDGGTVSHVMYTTFVINVIS